MLSRTARGADPERSQPRRRTRKTVHDWHEQALDDAGLGDLPPCGLHPTAAAA